jgi:hypothetical protein
VRELSGAVFIKDARERPVLFDSAEILGRSIVNKGWRKKPRSCIGQGNARASYEIKVVFISNNFALISGAEVSEQAFDPVIEFIKLNSSAVRMYLVVGDVYDKTIVPEWVEKFFELLDVELAKDIETHFLIKNMYVSQDSILLFIQIPR